MDQLKSLCRMLARALVLCGGLAACTPQLQSRPLSDLGQVLTGNDLRLSQGGDLRATLQLFPNGKGSAEFPATPEFPVAFDWSLRGDRFCMDGTSTTAAAGPLASYCARVTRQGRALTFTDLRSGVVSTATLIPR